MVISVDDAQRQFAFVKGNRPVNVRAVKQKEKSMKAYGQLTPIMVTDGERVIQMGGRLVDLKGNEIPDEDAGKYYAVLDGLPFFCATSSAFSDKSAPSPSAPSIFASRLSKIHPLPVHISRIFGVCMLYFFTADSTSSINTSVKLMRIFSAFSVWKRTIRL